MKLTNEQKELVKKNHNLIYGFLKHKKLDIEEYYGILAVGLCKAGIGYNGVDNFTTYAYFCMYNEVKNYWNHISNGKNIPEENIISYDNENYILEIASDVDLISEIVNNIYIKDILKKLNDNEKRVLIFLIEGKSHREIADSIGCTQNNICYIKEKIKKIVNGIDKN